MKYGNFGIPNFFSQSGKTLQQCRDEYSEWLTALRPEQAVNALMAEAMLEDEEVLLSVMDDNDYDREDAMTNVLDRVKMTFKFNESAMYDHIEVQQQWYRAFGEDAFFDKVCASDMTEDLAFYGNKTIEIKPWM